MTLHTYTPKAMSPPSFNFLLLCFVRYIPEKLFPAARLPTMAEIIPLQPLMAVGVKIAWVFLTGKDIYIKSLRLQYFIPSNHTLW